jgi:hypothetical protein
VSRCGILVWPPSILPRNRAHKEVSYYPKLYATNDLKAGRSLNGAPDALAPGDPPSTAGLNGQGKGP